MSTLDAVNEFEDDRGFLVQDFAIVKLLGKLGMQVGRLWGQAQVMSAEHRWCLGSVGECRGKGVSR